MRYGVIEWKPSRTYAVLIFCCLHEFLLESELEVFVGQITQTLGEHGLESFVELIDGILVSHDAHPFASAKLQARGIVVV